MGEAELCVLVFGIIFIPTLIFTLRYIYRDREFNGVKFTYLELSLMKRIKKHIDKEGHTDFEYKVLYGDSKPYQLYRNRVKELELKTRQSIESNIDFNKVTKFINKHSNFNLTIDYDVKIETWGYDEDYVTYVVYQIKYI